MIINFIYIIYVKWYLSVKACNLIFQLKLLQFILFECTCNFFLIISILSVPT